MNVCPECKTKIYNPSASFCYKCGHRINSADTEVPVSPLEKTKETGTSEAIVEEKKEAKTPVKDPNISKYSKTIGIEDKAVAEKVSNVSSLSDFEPDKLTKRWNTFILGANALSIMFLIVAVGLFFRANNEIVGTSVDPIVTVNNVEIKDEVEGEVFESEVLKSEIFRIVPKGLSLYAEGSNSTDFMINFLSEEEKTYLEQAYELSLEDLLVFIKPNYTFVVGSSGESAAILQTGGFDFFERTYSKYQANRREDAPVNTRRVGEFLVVSKDVELINSMEAVNSGSEASLSADPNFIKSVGSVGERAFAYIYTDSSDYVNEDLEGSLKIMDLEFIYDEIQKAGTTSVYVAKEGSKYVVKPID